VPGKIEDNCSLPFIWVVALNFFHRFINKALNSIIFDDCCTFIHFSKVKMNSFSAEALK